MVNVFILHRKKRKIIYRIKYRPEETTIREISLTIVFYRVVHVKYIYEDKCKNKSYFPIKFTNYKVIEIFQYEQSS